MHVPPVAAVPFDIKRANRHQRDFKGSTEITDFKHRSQRDFNGLQSDEKVDFMVDFMVDFAFSVID